MALMERVATLLRANLNNLVDRAEDPEKLLRQLVLDMENQLLQLKTQVAIALADQHLLEGKLHEQEEAVAGWQRKAELAVSKSDDALARAALERVLSHEQMLAAFRAQVADGAAESEALRDSYTRLGRKLAETQTRCEVLMAQHRRARMVAKANDARSSLAGDPTSTQAKTLTRMQSKIAQAEAQNHATRLLSGTADRTVEDQFGALEQSDRVEELLTELKSKGNRLLAAG